LYCASASSIFLLPRNATPEPDRRLEVLRLQLQNAAKFSSAVT
jgi:hypothetical protein